MIRVFVILLITFLGIASTSYRIYFENSDHQLEEITISGKESGPKALIFGGIHGDEPGSYFSAELLEHINLKNGTIVVFPRVNFPSIMLNRRQIFGDMNRKFVDVARENRKDPDHAVIEILKAKMSEADIFINLHDAHGFHREKYLSSLYNPNCYGQSLIFDTAVFYSRRWNREFNLEEISARIINRINSQLPEKYHFTFWNHRSVDKNTQFPEMKKSATHYALTKFAIPAFGLEISKNLPDLYLKVKYQLLAIAAILEEFGFKLSMCGMDYFPPTLYFVELEKNRNSLMRVNNKTIVRLQPGERIVIRAVYGNSRSGYSADVVDLGNLNDLGHEFIFQSAKRVLIRKNNLKIGEIYFRPILPSGLKTLKLTLNRQKVTIENWGVVALQDQTDRIYLTIKTDPQFVQLKICDIDRNILSSDLQNGYLLDLNKLRHFHLKNGTRSYVFYLYQGESLIGGFQLDRAYQ